VHVGLLEGKFVSLGDNDPAKIWITHQAQEKIVQIAMNWDEYLALEILRVEEKNKSKITG